MIPQLEILLQQAIQAFQSNSFDSADVMLKRVIQVDSKCLPALHILGLIRASQGKFNEAADLLSRAARLSPNDASIRYNLAKALGDCGLDKESIPHHKKAIEYAPNNFEAWLNYGKAVSKLNRHEEALKLFEKAIYFNPNYAEAHSNMGNALHALRKYDEALISHKQAIAIDENFAGAHFNLGITLQEMKCIDEAAISFKKAIELNFNSASASWNLALCNLIKGNFEDGLIQYEERWNRGEAGNSIEKRFFDKPIWLGVESLQGKTILLFGEQGLGDFLQFCRYAKLVSNLGAKVILEAPQPLLSLMGSLEGVSQVVAKGEKLPLFDYQCPLMSLPLALGTRINTIPSSKYYLKADSSKLVQWQRRLGEKTKKRVGVAWSSVSGFKDDSKRSLILSDFVKALPDEDFEYVCLQKEIKECDKVFFKSFGKIQFYGDHLNDFGDTAALIECVDLVVTTCTSIPHLSAALGKETWVLLSYVPDWRWFMDGPNSPWYPSISLFRQDKLDDWSQALQTTKEALLSFSLPRASQI